MGRDQLVLDMSRPEVVEYLYERISFLLSHYRIDYMKWDMNRNMTDVYSRVLSAKNQGQVFHRYILGVYDLLERLTCQFPEVLFEGCAGGVAGDLTLRCSLIFRRSGAAMIQTPSSA